MVQAQPPTSLQEAKKYEGQTILKFFDDGVEYKGTVQEVDTEVDTGEGVETGLFFRILYEDEDQEHLTWHELVKWLNHARKKLGKGKGVRAAGSAGLGGAADVTAVNDRTSNKRQRRSGGAQQNGDFTPQQQQDAADSGQYEQPARGSGGQSAGSKRRRAGNKQQQQDEEVKEEKTPAPAPAPATQSLRKNPRKSAKPRMAVPSPQEQQQQQQGRGRKQAAAAASDSEGEQEEDAVEDDDEAAGSDDYAPSTKKQKQQQRPSKKARTSEQQHKQRRRAAAEAADEELMDVDEAAAAEEEEEEEEEVDEELERQVARDQAAWEAQQAQPRNVTVRRQGMAGHLKQVQVVNFMCHHNFAMDFGTHVNVISGRNGSGKSAVLQAMQAALGSKAKDTGRGDNFRELVRTGCHEARVRVTLWNTGEDAYQHSLYGDWLTIERVIKTAGGTQYKLLSSTGKKIAEGHKQVSALLDHLNVDASNPLAVLTQDTARNFLCGSVADKKKYEIFMKATCLQTMYDYLLKASQYVQEMKAAFGGVKEEHDARKAKVDELQQKLEKLKQSASLVEQRMMFDRAVFWAAVKVQQDKRDKVKQTLEVKAPERRAMIDAALEEVNAELEEVRRKDEELLAAQHAEEEETRTFTEAMTALASQLKAAKAVTRGKQAAAKKLEQRLQQVQAEMKATMEAKRETNDDRQREYEEKLRHHEQQMAHAREILAQAEAKLSQAQQQKEGMRNAVAAKDQEVLQLKQKVQAEQGLFQNLQSNLQQLQAAKGQKLRMFGAHHDLRAMVDRNIRKFTKPPIGPIGAHLTLTDTKWATAGEVVLGKSLELWIVHNAKDNQTLRGMAKQVKGINRFASIVSNFDRPAYTIPESKRLRTGWRNLREFIRIDHPDARAQTIIDNKLMDETKFEVVVVHEDEEKCRDAIYNSAAGNSVVCAVHQSGLNFKKGRNDTITTSRFISRQANRIGASFEDQLVHIQGLLQQSQVKLQEGQQQLTAANTELQQLHRQINTLTQQEKAAIGAKSRAAHRVQQLQTQAPVLEIDEGDGEDLVAEQMRVLQEQANDLQLRHEKAGMELQEARLKEDQAKKLHEDRRAEMDQQLSQMNDRTEQLEQLAERKDAANKRKAIAEAQLQKHEQTVATLQARLDVFAQALQTAREAALKECTEEQGLAALEQACNSVWAEIEQKLRTKCMTGWRTGKQTFKDQADFETKVMEHVQRNFEQLMDPEKGGGASWFQTKAAALEREVANAEREAGGNQEELELNLKRANLEFTRNDRAVSNMRTVVEMCTRAVRERWQKYDELFASVSETVSKKFMGYMHRRGHHGHVNVNQETGELRLLVKINAKSQGAEAKKSKAVKDLKQLSGGERSFTTVAFILALGKFTESPFRAMDEYDVFMDAVNRRIATQTLLEFALEENNLQFVLLTPQDLQAVEDAKKHLAASKGGQALPEGFVKVVQMRPARNGAQQHH